MLAALLLNRAVSMDEIRAAAQALWQGHLVAFPTETVFGLGADATNSSAVARIYEAKGRPADHPLIVHVFSLEVAAKWASNLPDYALDLAAEFWPGPLTLILPRSELARDFITGGQDTVGVRVPSHLVALQLLREFEALGGLGVAAPSANRFGRVSPTSRADVQRDLGNRLSASDLILDGEPPKVGVESTIVDCTGDLPAILRPGYVTAEMIADCTGLPLAGNDGKKRVSGSLKSHYAPNAHVQIDGTPQPGDGLIALAGQPTPAGVHRIAAPSNLDEFAAGLYRALHTVDELGLERVVIIAPPGDGLAVAIRDRITKAAHRD